MTIASRISALLLVVRREDIEELPPIQRRKLADICIHIASLCEPPAKPEKSCGVLVELKTYRREG